jgi:uncharacterized membrane protein
MAMSQEQTAAVRIGRHPLHALLAHTPNVCFIAALLTDITYWKTADIMWGDFSDWLLAFGALFAVLAAVAGLIDFIAIRRNRSGHGMFHAWGSLVVLVLAILNNFVHSRDAYTSVVPGGLILSALTVLVLLVTGWVGGEMLYREAGR